MAEDGAVQDIWIVWEESMEMRGGDHPVIAFRDEGMAEVVAQSVEGRYSSKLRMWEGDEPPMARSYYHMHLHLDGPISQHNLRFAPVVESETRAIWEYAWPREFPDVAEVHNSTEYSLASVLREQQQPPPWRRKHLFLHVEGWNKEAVAAKFEEVKIEVLEVVKDLLWDPEGAPTT